MHKFNNLLLVNLKGERSTSSTAGKPFISYITNIRIYIFQN